MTTRSRRHANLLGYPARLRAVTSQHERGVRPQCARLAPLTSAENLLMTLPVPPRCGYNKNRRRLSCERKRTGKYTFAATVGGAPTSLSSARDRWRSQPIGRSSRNRRQLPGCARRIQATGACASRVGAGYHQPGSQNGCRGGPLSASGDRATAQVLRSFSPSPSRKARRAQSRLAGTVIPTGYGRVDQVRPSNRLSGTFWLAIGDEYAAEVKILSQDIGFTTRSWVIWYYTFGVNCTHTFTRSHAHLFYFVKDPKAFTFRGGDRENRVPSARQLVYFELSPEYVKRGTARTKSARPGDPLDGADEPLVSAPTTPRSRSAGIKKKKGPPVLQNRTVSTKKVPE